LEASATMSLKFKIEKCNILKVLHCFIGVHKKKVVIGSLSFMLSEFGEDANKLVYEIKPP